MFNKSAIQSFSRISSVDLYFRHMISAFKVKVPSLILLIPVLLSIGCAKTYLPMSKGPSIPYDAEDLISKMLDQEDRVSSFYSSGTVLVKGWAWQSEADLLIAGTRDPLKIKIEITHPWGRPILHILIDNKRIEILSFDEKRIYLGELTAESLSRFFLPGELCDHNLIWSVLRGYPHIADYDRIVSSGIYRINLINREEMDIEIIDLYTNTLQPKRVLFPQDSLDISFSGFIEDDGINYAEEVIVNNIEGAKDLALKTNKMVLNKPVPDQIFILEKPATFEIVYMDGRIY